MVPRRGPETAKPAEQSAHGDDGQDEGGERSGSDSAGKPPLRPGARPFHGRTA